MRIGFLGDIHSSAQTFKIALAEMRASGCDISIILGDLLTYGPDPKQTIDLAYEAAANGSVLIRGNHDQIYIDQGKGGSAYENALPLWIRESVDWTREKIGNLNFESAFDWKESWSYHDLFVAHANPYTYGDWTYLSTDAAFKQAAEALFARGFRHGIFGHTHRFSQHRFEERGVALGTVGSLGQPRNRERLSEWSIVELKGDTMQVEQRFLEYSWKEHLKAIEIAPFSAITKAELSKFFLP